MALVLKDRVRDTTTTAGTGTVTLSGTAPTGFQNFSAIGNGNTTYYTISGSNEWEVGIGTYSSTGPTLSRDTVLESSNAGALVPFSAGSKDVFVTYPAEKSVNYDASGNVGIGTSAPAGKLDVTGSSGSVVVNAAGDQIAYTFNGFNYLTASGAAATLQIQASGASGKLTFATAGSERMRIDASGNVGIGGAASTGTTLRIGKNLTGSVNVVGVYNNQAIQSDVTSNASLFATFPSTAASAFTLSSLYHFNAAQSTIGATSAITTQIGFLAQSSLTGATNNYGFYGAIASGTGRWNLYMAGTADNYLAGNVGIGTSAPVDKLQVEGNLYFGTSNRVVYSGGAANLTLQTSTGVLAFNTGGSVERMRITNSGYVSIGSTTPGSSKLYVYDANVSITTNEVAAAGTGVASNRWKYSTNHYGIYVGSVNAMVFYDYGASAERMRLDASGNLGIGTSSPAARVHIVNATIANQLRLQDVTTDATNKYGVIGTGHYTNAEEPVAALLVASQSASNTLFIGGGSSSLNAATAIQFYTAANSTTLTGTERMRIDSSGNVGIGTSAPGSLLHLGTATPEIRFDDTDVLGVVQMRQSGAAFLITVDPTGVDAGSNFQIAVDGAEAMRITSAGDVGIGTASPSSKLHVAGALTLNTALAIASGGTNGTATPTSGAVAYGTGTAYAFTSAGTAGQVLLSNGSSAPSFGSVDGGTF